MIRQNLINLTFDLEEFDIPEEYGQKVSHADQMNVTLEGTKKLMMLLDKHHVRATFFTTGYYALKNKELIHAISERHEIASHALFHDPLHEFQESDIAESKMILEHITGKSVTGFRMPRLKAFRMEKLIEEGYLYDSSLNPTYLPGRYNLLNESPLPHFKNGIMELPCSTLPYLRIPLFWLAFKNLPIALYNRMCGVTLRNRKSLMLYFHPWEFADIQAYKLPSFIKNPDGEKLLGKLEKLIIYLKKQDGRFLSCQEFCETLDLENAD